MIPASPQGFLASKLMHSDTLWLYFEPNLIILTPGTLSFPPNGESSSPFAPSTSFLPKMTLLHSRSPLASETTQSALSGGHHHLLTPPGPARTYPEPIALAKWPNVASLTSKHDGNEEIDNGKHLLGVLKGKDRLGLETMPRIVAREHDKWCNYHPFNCTTSQNTAPPLVVSESTRIMSLSAPCIANCHDMELPSPLDSLILMKTRITSSSGNPTHSMPSPMRSGTTWKVNDLPPSSLVTTCCKSPCLDSRHSPVSKSMLHESVPWVNDPRLPPHTTTCCDPSPQPSPQLCPLLLPQIVTAQCRASCLRPLRLVQALENGLKDSPHLHDTTMTHHEPTPSNPPMVVHTHQPCHSLAYPPLHSQIANSNTPMCAPFFPPVPLAWRLSHWHGD